MKKYSIIQNGNKTGIIQEVEGNSAKVAIIGSYFEPDDKINRDGYDGPYLDEVMGVESSGKGGYNAFFAEGTEDNEGIAMDWWPLRDCTFAKISTLQKKQALQKCKEHNKSLRGSTEDKDILRAIIFNIYDAVENGEEAVYIAYWTLRQLGFGRELLDAIAKGRHYRKR